MTMPPGVLECSEQSQMVIPRAGCLLLSPATTQGSWTCCSTLNPDLLLPPPLFLLLQR